MHVPHLILTMMHDVVMQYQYLNMHASSAYLHVFFPAFLCHSPQCLYLINYLSCLPFTLSLVLSHSFLDPSSIHPCIPSCVHSRFYNYVHLLTQSSVPLHICQDLYPALSCLQMVVLTESHLLTQLQSRHALQPAMRTPTNPP